LATWEQVQRFLVEFKQIVTKGRGVDLVSRRESLNTLRDLGLTKQNLEQLLLSLSPVNYCVGPKADRDRPGEVWVFGTHVQDVEIYIKLKIASVSDVRIAKCISFHPAEFSLKYPHKKRRIGGEP